MKKAFQIFRRDIKRLFHNRAALLIVVGVCILPSLYAWFNIAANMDPYVNTAGNKGCKVRGILCSDHNSGRFQQLPAQCFIWKNRSSSVGLLY